MSKARVNTILHKLNKKLTITDQERKFVERNAQRKCSVCKEKKPLGKYHKQNTNTYGYLTECKTCRNNRMRKYYQSKPKKITPKQLERIKEQKKKLYEKIAELEAKEATPTIQILEDESDSDND